MKKGLLFFTLISILLLGNITVYSQENLSNQINTEIFNLEDIDNDNSDDNKKKDKKIKEEKPAEFLGTPIYDAEDFWKLITKGIFNLLIIIIIVRYIYYP